MTDPEVPMSLDTLRSMYWTQAFLKALIVQSGGRVSVDMETFRSIYQDAAEPSTMELFFDRTDDAITASVIRGVDDSVN